MKYVLFLGRVCFSLIFIMTILSHFSSDIVAYAANQGVPFAYFLVPLSGIIATLGGLSVLFGFHAKIGAWLIILFLVPVTLMMHNFWTITDPMENMMQKIMFMKNLSMLGGAMVITYFGSGELSFDRAHKLHEAPTY